MSTQAVVRSPEARPVREYLNPLRMAVNLWRQRELTWQLARRELATRYRASRLGLLWSVITPLIMLAVYTFAFAIVFRARWGDDPNESRARFALTMFCGMLLFTMFAEVATRAPGVVVNNTNYVKKVIFPLEVLVPASMASALVNMLVGYGVWLVGWVLLEGTWPHVTAAWFPLLLLPVCLTTVGIAWVLASLGVFLRDVEHAVQVMVSMLFFATPIFYSLDRVPPPYRRLLEFNPLTHAVEGMRRALMWGQSPDAGWYAFSLVASALLALLGYAFFMKSKRAFADVL